MAVEQANFFEDEAGREARTKAQKRFFLALTAWLLWTVLLLGALAGAVVFLTGFFGWSTAVLPCVLGFLTGICLAAGIATSLQSRSLIILLLGLLILPGVAVYLAFLAGRDPRAYDASSTALLPFVVYAASALGGCLAVAKLWRLAPVRAVAPEKGTVPAQVTPPDRKEPLSHEQPSVDKAA